MKKLCSVLLVALLICSFTFCISASANYSDYYDYYDNGLFIPSPKFRNSSYLPYGSDTLIYEVFQQYSDYFLVYRFYMEKVLYNGSEISIYNGVTFAPVSNGSGRYECLVASPASFVCETYKIDLHTGAFSDFSNLIEPMYQKQDSNGKAYNFSVLSGYIGSNFINPFASAVYANWNVLYGGRDTKSLGSKLEDVPSDQLPAYTKIWYATASRLSYISAEEEQNIVDQQKSDERQQAIINAINQNNTELKNSIDSGFNKVNDSITQAANQIINAGSDMPSLDTDNEWMNDSLTKVNGWLDDLNEFKNNMEANKNENAENMNSAKTFLSGFFSVVPTSIIAVMSLGLVIIVVCKAVGR